MKIMIHQHQFEVELQVKKVKRTTLRLVGKDFLRITAPRKIPSLMIETMIISRYDWIIQEMNRHLFLLPNQVAYQGLIYECILDDSLLTPYQITPSTIYHRSSGLDILYHERRQFIQKRFLELSTLYQPVQIRYRTMKTRWGVCHVTKRLIVLNTKLVILSDELIDYVIYHELTHLLVPHHQREFYEILEKSIKNPKKFREKMQKYVFLL
jgi:hypothetical protein